MLHAQGGGKSEALKLLQSILPESIIKRMRSGQQFVADSHPHVCVLFTDIVGFTTMSQQVSGCLRLYDVEVGLGGWTVPLAELSHGCACTLCMPCTDVVGHPLCLRVHWDWQD